ncbi:hypothetical protein HF670_16400 [Acidithiobacillus thiooxidans]|uniref:hypothetical protein n=1 Tax=Acidithiobacillus thiooxidans TaxID=930 RepID=UPI001C06E530|nr:hypothetical protein [Acidithiobacillus thiooxidans]MBU2841076.1 hypothetical protein [Acidithiobacillus thiooxidans]
MADGQGHGVQGESPAARFQACLKQLSAHSVKRNDADALGGASLLPVPLIL